MIRFHFRSHQKISRKFTIGVPWKCNLQYIHVPFSSGFWTSYILCKICGIGRFLLCKYSIVSSGTWQQKFFQLISRLHYHIFISYTIWTFKNSFTLYLVDFHTTKRHSVYNFFHSGHLLKEYSQRETENIRSRPLHRPK